MKPIFSSIIVEHYGVPQEKLEAVSMSFQSLEDYEAAAKMRVSKVLREQYTFSLMKFAADLEEKYLFKATAI